MTRKRCENYRVKRFDEHYDDTVIDEVRKLPLKASDIYQRLTT